MARPCGCAGECGCTIVAVDGLAASGSGSTRDPLLIGLANPMNANGREAIMDAVGASLGTGLVYNDAGNTLSTRISNDAGNSISIGSDSGLFSSGGGGGGGATGITVDSLAATGVLGGAYGAGYAISPEGTLQSYEQAEDYFLRLVHVPVRYGAGSNLLACHFRTLSTYDPWTIGSGETTDTMDRAMWQMMDYFPSGRPASAGTAQETDGYFGYEVPDQLSHGTTVSDVMRLLGGKSVLYLELKDSGTGGEPAPTAARDALLTQIRNHFLQKSVIVGTQFVGSNAADNVLTPVKNEGIDTAVHITTTTEAATYTPAWCLSAGIKWVMIGYSVGGSSAANITLVTPYVDAGLRVMLTGTHRQWHWEHAKQMGTPVLPATTPPGCNGVFSSDPPYTQGRVNPYYRSNKHSWQWEPVDIGRHSYVGTIDRYNHAIYRGLVRPGQPNRLWLRKDVVLPPEIDPSASFQRSAYLILQGGLCPLVNPESYTINVGFRWAESITDKGRWISCFFAVPEDRSLVEWQLATSTTRGYQLQLTQAGGFVLQYYDGTPGAPPAGRTWTWLSGFGGGGNLAPNTTYNVKIVVTPTTITCSRSDGGGSFVLNDGGLAAGKYRGEYLYLGRHFFTHTAAGYSCDVAWENLNVTYP
jgi:hypothetical protein